MSKHKHHAFKVVYSNIVRILETDVHVAVPSVLDSRKSKPFEPSKAIWDTGASHTVITPSIVKKLNLQPIGKVNVFGVNSQELKDTFLIDIALPNNVIIPNVEVTESNINSTNSEILIGMDIIQIGDFAISNPNGTTIFSFCLPPHTNPVDLLEKTNRVNKRKH